MINSFEAGQQRLEKNNPVHDFLVRTLPFCELDNDRLRVLCQSCDIDFIPAQERIVSRDSSEVTHLLLIQKGGVKLFLQGEDGETKLADFRGEGTSLGQLALIRGSKANLDAETVEDTFFIRIPGKVFLELLASEPAIANYYLKNLPQTYLDKAFREIQRTDRALSKGAGAALFSSTVGDVACRKPVSIGMDATVRDAASLMAREKVGSLLVKANGQDFSGIITDTDLRNKVLAEGLDGSVTVGAIMSSPVLSVEESAACFDALLSMMRNGIHHLVVRSEGRVVGMITSHDILILQGISPFSLYREIADAADIDELERFGAEMAGVVRGLVEEGGRAGNIARVTSLLNEALLGRLLALVEKDLGPAPVAWCWLNMGSEGRREQTFRTDQDNALLYEDTNDGMLNGQIESYFDALARKTVEGLERCGFPLCPGGYMVTNPQWRKPLSGWKVAFEDWIRKPEPEEVRSATVFFDFRTVYGQQALGDELREHVTHLARKEEVFLRLLARDCVSGRPPLGLFRNFIVETDGEHRNTMDIKLRGIMPIVDFARLMALACGIRETGTITRLHLLERAGYISSTLHATIRDAYEFLQQLRLSHQLAQDIAAKKPDNHINPSRLSDLQKKTLKEAFAIIGEMQSFVREYFKLAQ